MDIVSFSTLNQNDLEIFKKFTSKIKLVLSDCSDSFFGDTLLGAYELPYEDMLKAFTLASKNNNYYFKFLKNQVTPKPINLYDGINILMNDFATAKCYYGTSLRRSKKVFLAKILPFPQQILRKQDY